MPRPARIEYEPRVNLAVKIPLRLHTAIKQACAGKRVSQQDWLVALLERVVGERRDGGTKR